MRNDTAYFSKTVRGDTFLHCKRQKSERSHDEKSVVHPPAKKSISPRCFYTFLIHYCTSRFKLSEVICPSAETVAFAL